MTIARLACAVLLACGDSSPAAPALAPAPRLADLGIEVAPEASRAYV